MNTVEKQLVFATKSALQAKAYAPFLKMTGEELQAIFKESMAQTVPLLAFEALPEEMLPSVSKIKSAVLSIAVKNIQVANEHVVIGKALEENHIPYCILKGCAAAYYYPKPESRAMGDVDFLVAPENVERAAGVLAGLGYQSSENAEQHHFHRGFSRRGLVAEMHYSISQKTEFGFEPAAMTHEIIANAQSCQTAHGCMKMPSPFHHAVITILHIYRHYIQEGIGLRHLCDWAVFVASDAYSAVADEFMCFAERWGLKKFAQLLSQAAVEYLGVTVKKPIAQLNPQLCSDFMNEIVAAGNFGRKKGETLHGIFDAKALKQKSKGTLPVFLKNVKDIVCGHWPKAAHNVFILLVGVPFFSLKYLFLALIGKRGRLHFIQDYKKSKKRAKLRAQLADDVPTYEDEQK